ncbi:uncharacterized protein LOC111041855 [Myzus persicae]|uniref:uncharacterized protein LOC111041855 n=1 Tax=Myzus persicae TaxID=13164 RepID=UPI000B9372D9|nr:uncharacterized protein LOC111041855 [Myzus persicae]XP_022181985.1 uncharacterized protein LOC111041855 [Myzus persicae]
MRPTPETGAKRKIDPEAAQSNRSIKTSRSTISSGSKSSSSNNRSHRSTSLIAPAAVVVAPAVVSATSAVEASTVVAAPAVVAVPAAGVPAFVVCGGKSLKKPHVKIEADAETIISSRSTNSVAPAAVIGSPRVIGAPPLVSSAGGVNRHSNSLTGLLKAEIKEESPNEIDYLKLVDQLYTGRQRTEKNNRMRPTDRGAVPENIMEPYNLSFWLGSDAEVASSSRSANSVVPSAVVGLPRVKGAPPLVSSAAGINRHRNSLTGPFIKIEADAETIISSRSANSVAPAAVIGSPRVIEAPPLVSSAGGDNRHSNSLTGPLKAEIKEESPYEIDYLKLVDQLYIGMMMTEKNNRMRPTDRGAVPENILEPYNSSFWLGSDAEVASSSRSANSVAPSAVIGSPRVIGAPPLVSSAGGVNRHSNLLTGPFKAEIKEESPYEIDYLKLVDQLYIGMMMTEKNNRMRPTDRGAVPENIMEPYHLSFQLGGDAEAASSSRSTVRNRSTSSSSSSSDDGTYLFK